MARTLTFRLLGHGIAYSASPAMMNAAFAATGMPHRYVLADVAEEGVPAVVAGLRSADAGGANVTVPFKGTVVPLLDDVSDEARAADAVNTIVHRAGRLVGHNTDMPATIDVMQGLCPGGVSHAVVLGAGGAGRAVVLALHRLGVERIDVLHRSDGSIARLPDVAAAADLLVNATPVGTGTDESLVPPQLLRPDLAVLDLVYRPDPSRLVRDARDAGAAAATGAAVLLGQAWRAFELWLERPAPIDVMREALARELENHE
jgi:shikimate dehydrogenase